MVGETRFKPGRISALWERFKLQLQSDPELASGVATWQMWDGNEEDTADVSYDMLPLLRLTPSAGGFAWTDETRYAGPFVMTFDIGVPSTRAADLFDFWEAIKNAIAPTTSFLGVMISLGCYQVTMTSPALSPQLFDGAQGLSGRGTITLSLNVDIS
jgi:hypothetical protein